MKGTQRCLSTEKIIQNGLSLGSGVAGPNVVATNIKQRAGLVGSRRNGQLLSYIQTGGSDLWVATLICRWAQPLRSQLSPYGRALGRQPGSTIWAIASAHKPVKPSQRHMMNIASFFTNPLAECRMLLSISVFPLCFLSP